MTKLFFNENTGEYITTSNMKADKAKKLEKELVSSGFKLVSSVRSRYFIDWEVITYYCNDCKKYHIEYWVKMRNIPVSNWFYNQAEMKKLFKSCKIEYNESRNDRHALIVNILNTVGDNLSNSIKDRATLLRVLQKLRLKELKDIVKSENIVDEIEKKLVKKLSTFL
jgi:hypothetical protein